MSSGEVADTIRACCAAPGAAGAPLGCLHQHLPVSSFPLVALFLPVPPPLHFSVPSSTFTLSSAAPRAAARSSGVTPETPPMASLGSPGSPRTTGFTWVFPMPRLPSPFPLLQHPDELHINEHDIPLGLTAVFWQDSQTKEALFGETTVWKRCLGAGALPAADSKGPKYPYSHHLQLNGQGAIRGAVMKRGVLLTK